VIRWYGTIKDIEDQKQAELARAETEERYRLAARATSDVIWDWM
jgi:PAS domain-containing protein